MNRLLLAVLTASALFVAPPGSRTIAAQPAQVQIERTVLTRASDWLGGARRDGLQVTSNADGELRLADGSAFGIFESKVFTSSAALDSIAAIWRADVPPATGLSLDVRGGPTELQLGDWQPLTAGDARPQDSGDTPASEATIPLAAGTQAIQLRARMTATAANASPVLSDIALILLNGGAGPARAAGLTPVPLSPIATLTPTPAMVQRADWSGAPAPTARVTRQPPRGIVLHQIGSDALAATLPYLRSLAAYQTSVLGWDDLAYHYIIDRDGLIYEGHVGGPTALVPRLAGGDTSVHIALIGSGAPSPAQSATLDGLLAWVGQAYAIAPLGQHRVGSAGVVVPNIAAHADLAPEVSDPSSALRDTLPALRQRANAATVRARWYFAEGNVRDYAERLAVLNIGGGAAQVRFRLLPTGQSEIVREATVQPGKRADLVLNEVISTTTDLPTIVESSEPMIAERFMTGGADFSVGPGIAAPSRLWYFAEGSTDASRTYLLLFNPQRVPVDATLTYMKGDGSTAEEKVRIPPQQRTVVTVGDKLPGVGFGARVIATQPIVAERTMIFGSGGFHTGPGIAELSRRWYFAEGTTQKPFAMYLLVLNPNAQSSNVAVSFLTSDGTSLTRRYAIPPTTRLAIPVNEVVPDLGVATLVEADRAVAVERAMYWGGGSLGSANAGATAPAFIWRFADGRTAPGYLQYLLVSNPSKQQARVTAELTGGDGKTVVQSFVMPAGSRYTLAVHTALPGQQAVSMLVRSTQPIVAERSIYQGVPDAIDTKGGSTALGVAGE